MLAPTIVGTTLYAPVGDTRLLGVDLRTEIPRDQGRGHHCQAWAFKTGGAVVSSPWLADGVLYVGSDDGCVYALE